MLTLKVMDVKTTLAQDCNISIALFRCMLFILSSSSETYIIEFKFLVFKSEISIQICTSANTRRFSSVAVRLIKHRPVPGRALVDLYRDFRKFLAFFTHRTMPGRAPYGALTVALKSYDLNIKPKSCGARPMCANAGRAPYADVILPSMTLQNAVRAPWNFK